MISQSVDPNYMFVDENKKKNLTRYGVYSQDLRVSEGERRDTLGRRGQVEQTDPGTGGTTAAQPHYGTVAHATPEGDCRGGGGGCVVGWGWSGGGCCE